jgi:isopenicillin N synthase-like dioxygenase
MTDLGVVDLGWPIERQAAAIDTACTELGFFQIVGHGADLGPMWRTASSFFDLPDHTKQRCGFPFAGAPYGWSPMAFETLASSIGDVTPPDLKESLSVGPDCLGDAPDPASITDPDERWIRTPSVWPDVPHDLRSVWTGHFRQMSDVSARLMAAMAVALDLPHTRFDELIDHHTSAMRAIRYPALTGPPQPGQLRAGAHTDYGTLTILATDGVAGLEVLAPTGEWHPVAHRDGALVVNLGDSMAMWTNDRWRSTLHRVAVTEPDRQRHSIAFFHMANWDAVIDCLPTCLVPGETPRHEAVVAGPWLMGKFQRTVAPG